MFFYMMGPNKKILRPFRMQPADASCHFKPCESHSDYPRSRTGAGEGVLRGSPVPHALDALIGGRF
jgi:hypothetical protein